MPAAATPTLSQFAGRLLDTAHRQLLRSMDGLADDILYHLPSPHTNSIAWLAWHLSRWKDRYASILTGQPQIWVSEGWAERFGMREEDTGQGDTSEQVAAFRPNRDLLLGYVEAAHKGVMDRIENATPEQWLAPQPYGHNGESRISWEAFVGTVMDFSQHAGQAAYVRGLLEGRGWRD
ncbi:MAG: DinB family protein [Dehalococcoidia bacterium]